MASINICSELINLTNDTLIKIEVNNVITDMINSIEVRTK